MALLVTHSGFGELLDASIAAPRYQSRASGIRLFLSLFWCVDHEIPDKYVYIVLALIDGIMVILGAVLAPSESSAALQLPPSHRSRQRHTHAHILSTLARRMQHDKVI